MADTRYIPEIDGLLLVFSGVGMQRIGRYQRYFVPVADRKGIAKHTVERAPGVFFAVDSGDILVDGPPPIGLPTDVPFFVLYEWFGKAGIHIGTVDTPGLVGLTDGLGVG